MMGASERSAAVTTLEGPGPRARSRALGAVSDDRSDGQGPTGWVTNQSWLKRRPRTVNGPLM